MKEIVVFARTSQIEKPSQLSQKPFKDEISSIKAVIKNIKNNHKEKLIAAQKELQTEDVMTETKINKIQQQITQEVLKPKAKEHPKDEKNNQVSDSDKMFYQKRFKNFLNHRQEFQALAKQRREKIIVDRKHKQKGQPQIQYNYQDQGEILKEGNEENLFKDADDMIGFYEQITFGKKNKKGSTKLYHGEKIQEKFRKSEFDYLLEVEEETQNQGKKVKDSISKDTLLNYLFDEPAIMMLYSINPYQLGDQLAEFQTLTPEFLTYEDFSNFLLLDRQPTYFQYSKENLEEARKIGRGIKCQPIISKWIGDPEIYDWFLETFQGLDILGESKVEKQVLVRKLRKQGQKKRILDEEIIEIVNINKLITIDRLLYEIQHSTQLTEKITDEIFVGLLNHYHRLNTPEKDKLITKLILNGKYDPSYVYIIGNQPLEIIKQTFKSMQKFAQYFVTKQKFAQKLVKNPKFNKIRNLHVRSQGNRYVKIQTVEITLVRFLNQAETYVDIQEILDFFTNRGRPRKVQHQIYIANLERQLKNIEEEELRKQQKKLSEDDFSTSSDQEEFQKSLKEKKIQRKKDKLASIRAQQKFSEGKKFNVTVPRTFSFGDGVKEKTKVSIRQKKLKQQLEEKKRAERQSMVPIKPKPVPQYVKQELYQRLLREQERERKQRLQRFKLESQQNMCNISPHLLSKPKSKSFYQTQPKTQKFVAKPLPWYCEVNLLQRIQRQKEERRQKILQQIIDKHNDFDMPEGFQKMIERGQRSQQQKQRARALSKTTANDKQCTFNPRITQGIPNFEMIHQHLEIDLLNKKQQKEPIKVLPFSFENRPYRSRTTVEPQIHRKPKYQQPKHQDHEINIPITQKHLAFVNMRKKQQEEKIQKIEEEKRASAVRKMRQQKFAPYVREVLRKSRVRDVSQSKAMIESKIKEFKMEERKRKREYEEQMIKIYTKVFNRPLLVEGQSQHRIENLPQGEYEMQRPASNKRPKKSGHQSKEQSERFAENYDMPPKHPKPQQKINPKQDQYDDMRRKAMNHPPRNYLMQDPNGENEEEGQNHDQQEDYDDEYLSQNGRYTN